MRDLFDTADEILHEAELGHILRLQVREFFRQVVGIHILIGGDEHFLLALLNQRKIAAPFVFHPNCVEIFRLRAERDHDLGRVQRGENVRFVGRAELVFEGDARKEDLKALLRELVIEVVSQNRVGSSSAVAVRFFVTNEDVKRLFLLRNGEDALLNLVDRFGFFLINRLLITVSILQGRLIVVIVKDRGKLGAVDRRHTLVCRRILDVFDAVAAEHQRPIRFGIGAVLVEQLLVNAHRLVKFAIAAEVVGAVVHVGKLIVVEFRQGLLCAAVFAFHNAYTRGDFQCAAAHFTFKECHGYVLLLFLQKCRPILLPIFFKRDIH